MDAQDREYLRQAGMIEGLLFFDDRQQHVHDDADPDLGAHGVGRCAVEAFDPQVLFDPLEKQLDLPAATIEIGDGQCWQSKIVGKEHQVLAGCGIFESDPTQGGVEVLLGVKAREHDGLIADQSGAAIDGMGIAALGFEIGFGTGDKEAFRLVQLIEPIEVDVTSVHDVESAGLGQQEIEDVDVVQFAVADVKERRDVAPQIQQRVQLDGCLGRAKRSPRKDRQTQVDGAGVQSVNRVLEIDTKGFFGIEATSDGDQRLGEVGVDAPVPTFVGIGQSAARDSALDPHVVELGLLCTQARFDVAQALPISQLGERHAKILIETRESFDFVGSAVTCHTTTKCGQRQMLCDLGKYQRTCVHPHLLRKSFPQDGDKRVSNSNRDQAKS